MGKETINTKKFFPFIICGLLGLGIGFFMGKSTVQETSYHTLPQNELPMLADFFEVGKLQYKDNQKFVFTAKLSDKGKQYLETDLFREDYNISVTLINNQTQSVYFEYADLKWDLNEKKESNFTIDGQADSFKNRDDFMTCIDLVKKGKDNQIQYIIEFSDESNDNLVLRFVGLLEVES